jgi:glycosyltransferase involved in cell wall biosynthesis
MVEISALILTHNEERNIGTCLKSLVGVDEIVVVDSGSTDRTCAIAEENGARILTRSFDSFSSQRNFGLDTGGFRNEWVLHLDADEVATPEFLKALEDLQPMPGIDGYLIPSKTILNGRWLRYSGMYPTYQVRLGHRDRMRFKQVGHGQREDLGPERVGTFPVPYLHFNFSHGIAHWLRKHVTYAEAEADQYSQEAVRPDRVIDMLSSSGMERRRALKRFVNRLPLSMRPSLRFFYVYVVRLGFLDGRAGLQYAIMLACYEAMTVSMILDKEIGTQTRNI